MLSQTEIIETVRQGLHDPIVWTPISPEWEAMTDVLKVNGFRVCVSQETSEQLCGILNCELPTPKLEDECYLSAKFIVPAKVGLINLSQNEAQRKHNEHIKQELLKNNVGTGVLISGLGKTWCNYPAPPGKAVNYGYHGAHAPYRAVTRGLMVYQPVSFAHNRSHFDYSQKFRGYRRRVSNLVVETPPEVYQESLQLLDEAHQFGVPYEMVHPVKHHLSNPVPKERVKDYLSGALRDGKNVGTWAAAEHAKGNFMNWCAAVQGWVSAANQTFPWRLGALELSRDAHQAGRWMPVAELSPTHLPSPGSLAIYRRGSPKKGLGHVRRMTIVNGSMEDPNEWFGIGGNEEGGRWKVGWFPYRDPQLIGFYVPPRRSYHE
jgi:hypothetical protein